MSTKQIHTYAHCRTCTMRAHRPKYAVGVTRTGIQIWCERCDKEVAHFSPADIERLIASGPQCECCPGGMHRN